MVLEKFLQQMTLSHTTNLRIGSVNPDVNIGSQGLNILRTKTEIDVRCKTIIFFTLLSVG